MYTHQTRSRSNPCRCSTSMCNSSWTCLRGVGYVRSPSFSTHGLEGDVQLVPFFLACQCVPMIPRQCRESEACVRTFAGIDPIVSTTLNSSTTPQSMSLQSHIHATSIIIHPSTPLHSLRPSPPSPFCSVTGWSQTHGQYQHSQHTLAHTHSLKSTHSSLTLPPTHSRTHSLSVSQSLNHSLSLNQTQPLTHSLTHSLTHPPLTHSQ